MSKNQSVWEGGQAYEPYVGRWSRPVARDFLDWLAIAPGAAWLDVGCGTGALTETVVARADPGRILGVDPAPGFLSVAREQVQDPRVDFAEGNAGSLPVEDGDFDVVVSGLVLNFVPDLAAGLQEMRRSVRRGGTIAAYVWDYAGKMELMRYFWNAAVALKPADRDMDEAVRFPVCNPDALTEKFESAGLTQVATTALDIPTRFVDFDDYWTPFLGGQFPAPDYAMALSQTDRDRLRDRIQGMLPVNADGSIDLIARAWAVRGLR